MELIDFDKTSADAKLTLEELLVIKNVLHEVCIGLDLFEFSTRMGSEFEEVKQLEDEITSLISIMSEKC